MAKTTLYSNVSGGNATSSATNFLFLVQGILGNVNQTTESSSTVTWRAGGYFSNMACDISSNDKGVSTYNFRKNGADGNQTFTIGASATGHFEDLTRIDPVVAGDTVCLKEVVGAAGTVHGTANRGAVFNSLAGAVTRMGPGVGSLTAASSTVFNAFGSSLSSGTVEANEQFKFKQPFTLRNLGVRIVANARTNNTVYGTRKNSLNGNLSTTVGAGATGYFEDTTNTDLVAANDVVGFYITTGTGTEAIQGFPTIEVYNENNYQPVFNTRNNAGRVVNAAVTNYTSPSGFLASNQATETVVSAQILLRITATNLQAYIIANTVTATSTVNFRINAANGSQTLSVGASATGFFEDTTNQDVFNKTDLIAYAMTTGATGTSLTWNQIGIHARTPSNNIFQLLGVGI